jgi:site-specific recombinase XerD
MSGGNATLVDIQLLLGHQRATTTDIYLRSLSSSISHVAQFIEEDVLPKTKDSE